MDENQALADRVADELMQGLLARHVNRHEVVEAVRSTIETTWEPMPAAISVDNGGSWLKPGDPGYYEALIRCQATI